MVLAWKLFIIFAWNLHAIQKPKLGRNGLQDNITSIDSNYQISYTWKKYTHPNGDWFLLHWYKVIKLWLGFTKLQKIHSVFWSIPVTLP